MGWWKVGWFSMAMSVLGGRKPLVDIVRPISVFGINGLRNQPSHLVGPPFLAFKVHFSATLGWHCPSNLIESLLISGCG